LQVRASLTRARCSIDRRSRHVVAQLTWLGMRGADAVLSERRTGLVPSGTLSVRERSEPEGSEELVSDARERGAGVSREGGVMRTELLENRNGRSRVRADAGESANHRASDAHIRMFRQTGQARHHRPR
jgi:hypothetical protein